MNNTMNPINQTFLCPITHVQMVDPVVDNEGNSYERNAITNWLSRNRISPITRSPLNINQLIPNRALKDLIDSQNKLVNTDLSDDSTTFDSSDEESNKLSIDIKSNISEISNIYDTLISIKSNDSNKRLPLDIVVVIDVSGSMNSEATIKGVESSGLSTLDIVKHATKTIIEVLSRNDRIAIVKYSNAASVVLELTKMDKTGKALATSRLNTLQPDGVTNLWDGIYKALEILKSRNARNNVNSAIFLLTDGEPNVDPPKGYIPTLQSYCDKNGGKYPGIISTFGFGYSLNSPLLESIAKECNGTYAFIPDSGFVGTVFENALANTIILRGTNATLCIEPLDNTTIEELDDSIYHNKESWGFSINVGNIQYGQNRDFFLKLSTSDGTKPSLNISLRYNDLTENSNYITINDEKRFIDEYSENIIFHSIRQKITSFINFIMTIINQNNDLCKTKLESLIAEIKKGYTDSNINALLKDLEGQISESIIPNQFNKWGKHYLPSLKRAHELQQCNNFKDPGVQTYGGKLFKKIRDDADDIFINKIPSPTPSLNIYSGSFGRTYVSSAPSLPIDMGTFNSQDNACFHGNSKVELANGTYKFASEIIKGDLVKLGNSKNYDIGEIECVVKTMISSPINLIKVSNDLILTPWHPVKVKNTWKFPCDIEYAIDCSTMYCEAIYSFIITAQYNSSQIKRGNGRGMIIGGIECATLGHGILNSSVISHPFFGTESVIDNLKLSKTYYEGLVILDQNSTVRNTDTNLIYGINI
jgi:Mg-chelatase subunit ChlD